MANSNGLKGNPASVRMANPVKKATRERSWRRGQERKAARRKEQEAAAQRNADLRERGLLTPHEQKRAERAGRRLRDPEVQKRAQMHQKRAA